MNLLRVKVLQGELEGCKAKTTAGKDYCSFKGIPYAEAPTGILRFKAPVPVKKWSGIKSAVKEGNVALQIDEFTKKVIGDEDCLYLNVHTPSLPIYGMRKLYPVLVYIHPGGFITGSSSSDFFGPDYFIEQDIVFVSISYRLGIFGFLCLQCEDATGNMGLRDQVLALKWIKDNIVFFNGDPGNVTVMGISAGSASIEYHMVSPMSKGLFHKAILQSGSCSNKWTKQLDHYSMAKRACEQIDKNINDPVDFLRIFKSIDARKLMLISSFSVTEYDRTQCDFYHFTVVIEKIIPGIEPFLCENPQTIMKSGRYLKIPTITGFIEKEGILFKDQYVTSFDEILEKNYIKYLPDYFKCDREKVKKQLIDIYKPSSDDLNDNDRVYDFLSDLFLIGGIVFFLKYRMRNERDNYLFKFKYDSKVNFVKTLYSINEKGACHGDEASFLAPNNVVNVNDFNEKDKLLKERMVQMWSNFIKTGNPTSKKTNEIKTDWLPVRSDNMEYLEIDEELTMKSNPFPERIAFWNELYMSQ